MSEKPLSAVALASMLVELPGWTHDSDTLAKTYIFADFREAFAFMVRVAFEAEAMDHHPEWTNVYNRVEVKLSTHSAGHTVTAKDVDLARCMDRVRDN